MLEAVVEFLKVVIFFIPILGLVVTIHELGHYWAGRIFGAAAESFSVGFGNSLIELTDKRGTRWRINSIPFGGFVSFIHKDENGQYYDPRHKDLIGKPFRDISRFGRMVIFAAGPLANFVLTILLLAGLVMVNGQPVQSIKIVSVVDEPAISAGFEPGDYIHSIDGTEVTGQGAFLEKIALSSGTELQISVLRNESLVALTATPVRAEQATNGQGARLGRLGVSVQTITTDVINHGPFSAISYGVAETGNRIAMTTTILGRILTGRESVNLLSGPVAIGDTTRRIVDQTMAVETVPVITRLQALFWQFIFLSALVSVGVGFINLLPLPVLDGGHIAMLAYEAITGSEVPAQVQGAIMMGGFVLIIGLFVVITGGDIVETGILSGNN